MGGLGVYAMLPFKGGCIKGLVVDGLTGVKNQKRGDELGNVGCRL